MNLSFKLPSQTRVLMLILIAIYLVTRIPLLFYLPFIQDEALYAVMIAEQAESPTLIPTFMEYPVGWKPAPFFWLHVPFNELPLPLEARLRLPSMLAGLISIPVIFRLLQNVGISRAASFFTMLLFLFSIVTAYPHGALLTDSILFLFISSALLLYTEKSLPQWRFLGAALLTFLAFFTKLFLSFMIPLLAIAYFLTKDRKTLGKPLFILSLLAIPLAMGVYAMIYSSAGAADQLQFSIGANVANPEGVEGHFNVLIGAMEVLVEGMGVWFALSIFGFIKHWKSNLFMSVWYLLSIFPTLTGAFMPWYFLPVAPAIAYFGVMLLIMWKGRERIDTLFWAFIGMAILLALGLGISIYVMGYHDFYKDQREAGLLLAGKDNVLIMGGYNPGIFSYKIMNEEKRKDFGWLLLPKNASDAVYAEYLIDYHSSGYPTQDGSFGSMFSTSSIYRKDTNITRFDYVAIVGERAITPPDSHLIFNQSRIAIYKSNRITNMSGE